VLKLSKYFTETRQIMQNTYGDRCLGRTKYCDWFKRAKHSRESVDDDPRSGRPSTSADDVHVINDNEIVHFNK